MNGNGIDGSTGRYLPEKWEEAAERSSGDTMDPELERHYEWLQDQFRRLDPERLYTYGVDPKRLDSAGWAVIFGPRASRDKSIRDALEPFLEHRKRQAGRLYKELTYGGQSKFDFLREHRVPPGPAHPPSLPYYLLIVGDPEDVPFHFQTDIDLDYGVGRISFEKPEQYKAYVEGVLAAESGTSRPKGVTIFGVANDEPTQVLQSGLLDPLASALEPEAEKKETAWPVRCVTGRDANMESLRLVAGGEKSTSVLITGSHGLAFPSGHPRQVKDQGALFLGAAQNPEAPAAEVPAEIYFSGEHLAQQPDLRGMIIGLFACYSAGTPTVDSYREKGLSIPREIAPRPFVSHLAQQLLSQQPQGGALAVLGHLDRMWSTSFRWSEPQQIAAYEAFVKQLIDGHPAGSATELLGQLHGAFGTNFARMSEKRANLSRDFDQEAFYRSWRGYSDACNFILLGDPAVRLVHGG